MAGGNLQGKLQNMMIMFPCEVYNILLHIEKLNMLYMGKLKQVMNSLCRIVRQRRGIQFQGKLYLSVLFNLLHLC